MRGDRVIIVFQLLMGVVLIMFGAFLAVVFSGSAQSIGTAVIGAGAALLPAGAAAAASTRVTSRE